MLEHKRLLTFAVVAVLCILLGALEAQALMTSSNVFPVQDGIYELVGPTTVTYPGASIPGSSIDIELVSMSLTNKPSASTPPVIPPPDGLKYEVDSFFDIDVTLSVDGASDFPVDSFFDVFTRLSIENPTDGAAGQFDTEILSMDLSGPATPIPGTTSNLEIRLSLTIPSVGETTITDLGPLGYWNEAFYNVFMDLRVDGGP